jgi:hypothetical protein
LHYLEAPPCEIQRQLYSGLNIRNMTPIDSWQYFICIDLAVPIYRYLLLETLS